MKELIKKIIEFKGTQLEAGALLFKLQRDLKLKIKRPRDLEIIEIITECGELWNVSYTDVISKTRTEEIVFARQLAQYIIKYRYPDMSLARVGMLFMKNHATVIHSIKIVDNYRRGKSFYTLAKYTHYNVDKVNRLISKWQEPLDYDLIDNISIADIDPKDAPDFTDAYIESADYKGREMTEQQLDQINENRDFVYEQILNKLY